MQNQEIPGLSIISKPIVYDADRINLSLDYLRERHGLVQKSPRINPKIIVIANETSKHKKTLVNLEKKFKKPRENERSEM